MTRTSKALQRLGVAGLAVATIGAGVPAFFATAAQAATGPALVADDCTVPSTSNTTTTNNAAPFTGSGTGCTTQAKVGTVKTLTFTFTNNGTPTAGQDIDFTLAPSGGTANFPNTQPAGTTSQPDNANNAGQLATCTTNAAGKCSVNVTDSAAESVTVTGTARGTGQSASEVVEFRANSVAIARVDETDRKVVAPETSNGSGTGGNAANAQPSPGRPIELTYQVTDANGGNVAPNCGATNANPNTCTGEPVANQLVTVKVNSAAFFTPNCTPKDPSGAPQRNGSAGTGPTPGPAVASTGRLVPPDYRSCSFATAPANGAVVGPLTNLGQTLTVRTDENGEFTVTVAEGRDAGFDDDGNVTVALTVTEQGSNTDLSPRDQINNGGAAADPLLFTTQVEALNGFSVAIVPVDGSTAATSTTQNVPDNQTRTFVVQLRDQYGNLTRANGNTTGRNSATLTKKGVGTLFRCEDGNSNRLGGSTSTNSCSVPLTDSASAGNDSQNTVENNGTTTQVYSVIGSYTNRSEQERFRSVPNAFPGTDGGNPTSCFFFGTNCPTPSQVEDGTQTLTASWLSPVTTFIVDTTANAPAFGTTASNTANVAGFDQSKTKELTDVASFNFYRQVATDITFSTTPSNTVTPGTVVTVSARVLDQFGNPVQGQPVQFFRTGSSNNCTSTTQNGTGNGGATTTGPDGRAGFSFSCDASQQTVTIVVTDQNGNELKRGTQSVTFANAQQPQSPAATNTASTSPSASQSTSPSASASASQSTSPAPSCTPAQQNLRIKYLVTQGKVGNGQVGPVANATQLVTVQIDGATPGGTIVLEAYQQNHFGTATFANSGNLRTAVADSAGVAKIDVRFSSNARTRARMQGCTFSTTSNNNSGYSQGSGANGNVLYVKTVLTFTVTRVNVTTLRISGDSLPARPGGLIVNIDCKDAKCRAGVNQNGNNPNGILLQPRANPTNGEFGPVEYTFKTFKAGERVTLYATTGDPDTGKGDAQNIAGRSNDRSVVFVR